MADRVAPRLLVAVTAVLLALAATGAYVRAELADPGAFAVRTAAALDDRQLRREVAVRLFDGLSDRIAPDALVARPAGIAALDALAGRPGVRARLEQLVAARHSWLTGAGEPRTITLTPDDPTLAAMLRGVARRAGTPLPVDATISVATLDPTGPELTFARALQAIGRWTWPLLAAAALALAACVLTAGTARRALARGGAAVGIAGVLVAAATAATGAWLGARADGGALGALWSSYTGDLATSALAAALAGLGVAALAARAVRRLALAAVGVAAAAGLVVALVLPGPAPSPAAPVPPDRCDAPACAKRLDEATLAATHNSYAASDEPGWYFGSQRRGIARQLEDGVRAFLVDVHYGVAPAGGGPVRTDLAYEGSSRNKVVEALGPRALAVADRLGGRVGAPLPSGPRALYLCHTLCELGSEPLGEQLGLFTSFLATHPDQVVVLVVEPYAPAGEIARAFAEAGLAERAAVLRPGAPLPELGELVRAGTRLVVFTEEDGGEPSWYMDAFTWVQDTPLGATRPEQLRCGRFRGRADSPLLMLNHWIPPFPPSVRRNEAIGGEALARRVRRCARARGQRVNLLAVDFYERTGVVELAERLTAAG
ncbi:MAG TPA: hypothetical protein VD836_10965 [Solirubrobacteraceae bacterium]|nr:hypothetical protein [Solirubrobacteraceae bacterium]